MKAIFEFNLDDAHEQELHMRHVVADKMAALLFDICHPERPYSKFNGKIPEEVSKAVLDACYDEGINFEEIYT